MILSQTLGDDFLRLNEDQLELLNTVLEAELVRNDEVRKVLGERVKAAHRSLGTGKQ